MPNAYYPMFADLSGRRCVIVGGGMVAQRKATTLLRYGADLLVISPILTDRLQRYARQGKIRHVARRFKPGDLRGAWLIYAATNDEPINERVSRAAIRRRIFTNVVDQKPLCSFIAPAIIKRGELVVAISTGGASPTMAKRLRREVACTIGSDYVRMLKLLGSLRSLAKRRLPSYQDRKRYFDRLVLGRTFELVRRNRLDAAKREAIGLLERATVRRQRVLPLRDPAVRPRTGAALRDTANSALRADGGGPRSASPAAGRPFVSLAADG